MDGLFDLLAHYGKFVTYYIGHQLLFIKSLFRRNHVGIIYKLEELFINNFLLPLPTYFIIYITHKSWWNQSLIDLLINITQLLQNDNWNNIIKT